MNIINKTPILELNMLWLLIPAAIFILILSILCTLSIWTPKRWSKIHVEKTYYMTGAIGLILFLVWFGIANAFLQTPTDDKYTYEVTFDNIETINEWFDNKTFIKYNDGVYTFKDKIE